MRGHEMWRSRSASRLGVLAAVASSAAVVVPIAASANSHSKGDGPPPENAAATSVVYGGRTAHDWPVVIELRKDRRRVMQAVIGLRMPCTSGIAIALPDRYVNLSVNRKRRFRSSFGPDTVRNDDGTTTDFEGSISGALNRARSKLSGRWRLKRTDFDTAGAATDSCDSGSVSWTAKE